MLSRVMSQPCSRASCLGMFENKWFLVAATFFGLDIISILIDGLFFKALSEAPQDVLLRDDANELKPPVLVFVIFVCIIQLINIWLTLHKHLFNGDSQCLNFEKEDLPILISVLVVWIDFAQIVIALSTAFRTNQLIGNVQVVKPLFGILKTFVQISALVFRYNFPNERSSNNFSLLIIALVGFLLNFLCSFCLLVTVCINV